jgi:hypothetical protein
MLGNDIIPLAPAEKLMCALLMLLGAVLLAVIFGNVSLTIDELSRSQTSYQKKMEMLYEVRSQAGPWVMRDKARH